MKVKELLTRVNYTGVEINGGDARNYFHVVPHSHDVYIKKDCRQGRKSYYEYLQATYLHLNKDIDWLSMFKDLDVIEWDIYVGRSVIELKIEIDKQVYNNLIKVILNSSKMYFKMREREDLEKAIKDEQSAIDFHRRKIADARKTIEVKTKKLEDLLK